MLLLCRQLQLLQLVWVVRGLLLVIKAVGKWKGFARTDNSAGSGGPVGGDIRAACTKSSRSSGKTSRGKSRAAAAASVATTSSSVTGAGAGPGSRELQQQRQGQPGIMHQARCLVELDSGVLDVMVLVVGMLWELGGSRGVIEATQEVEALLKAQDSNTLHAAEHYTPPVAPKGAAAAAIMQMALEVGAARAEGVEAGGEEGNASASILATLPVGGGREQTVAGGSSGTAVVGDGSAAAERPEVPAAGGAGTGYDADVFKLLQMLARPDLAAAAIAAVPAAAATDPVAFCSSIVSRVSRIRLLPEAVVKALERVAALQGKGEGEDGDVKEDSAGSNSSSTAGASAAAAEETAGAAAAAGEYEGSERESSGGATVSGVGIEEHQAGGSCTGEGASAEATSMDPRECDETQLAGAVVADGREVLVTAASAAAMIELLHVFVAEVPLPVGCNRPHCPAGVDEAVATRKCTGCKLAVYCSDGCLKEHWKEHKGVCRRVQAARKELAANGSKYA